MCSKKCCTSPEMTYEMYEGESSPLPPLSPPPVAADPPFFACTALSRCAISSCCVSAIKLKTKDFLANKFTIIIVITYLQLHQFVLLASLF